MPHLVNNFRPEIIKVVTKTVDGQAKVDIALELTINLKADGITIGQAEEKTKPPEDVWIVPEFGSKEKLKFGKKGKP